jgi:flagellar FliL protein
MSEERQTKKLNFPKVLLMVVGLVVLMVGGGIAGSLFTSGKASEIVSGISKKEEQNITVPQDEFLINLKTGAEGKKSYLKIELSLSTLSQDNEVVLTENSAQVRDAIIGVLRNKTSDNIFDEAEGTLVIKNEIIAQVNQKLGTEVVSDVYVTNIVMQ